MILSGQIKILRPYIKNAYGYIKSLISSDNVAVNDDGDTLTDKLSELTNELSKIDEISEKVDSIVSNKWTQIINHTTTTATTYTVSNVSNYKEFLICVGLASSSNANLLRVLASTTIPKELFVQASVDHGDGAHQVYYNSSYKGGASWMGNNKIKVYSSSITRIYAR